MQDSNLNTNKIALIEQWLSAHQSVVVFINSKAVGLKAPASQTHKPSFSLALSHFFDRPLIIKKDCLEAELLFDNSFFKCVIPWKAIWAAYPEDISNLLQFWNEDSPGPGWDKALMDYLKVDPDSLIADSSVAESALAQTSVADKQKSEITKLKLALVQDLGMHIVDVALSAKEDLALSPSLELAEESLLHTEAKAENKEEISVRKKPLAKSEKNKKSKPALRLVK